MLGPLEMESSRCDKLASPNIPTFSLSVFIVFGILISYLPQHYRIIARRSSEGLSPWFVLLGTTSSSFALFNILCLPTSQKDILCCLKISHFACLAALLGIAQVAVQQACFTLIMFLFLIFFPTPGPDHPPDAPPPPTWRTALFVVLVCATHSVVLLVVSLSLLLWAPGALGPWAVALGACAAILACIQYVPQLMTTWRLGHVMSLSIPMMCIQTPGSFVFAASLAARLGSEGWSSWGVYVVTGVLQGGLLTMGIWFELRDRAAKRLAEEEGRSGRLGREWLGDEDQMDPDETSALLGSPNGQISHGTIGGGNRDGFS